MNQEQLTRMRDAKGFIAALDQSGGSTPKALNLYGIADTQYSGDAEMFDVIHAMRSRMVMSPAFNGTRVLGAILFEGTMDRQIEGLGSAEFLWTKKQVIPFLKIDKGLADEQDDVQIMKPNPDLDALLARAAKLGIFGTKMRSVIKLANADGITAVVAQQFEVGRQILRAGLVPIIEPDIARRHSLYVLSVYLDVLGRCVGVAGHCLHKLLCRHLVLNLGFDHVKQVCRPDDRPMILR